MIRCVEIASQRFFFKLVRLLVFFGVGGCPNARVHERESMRETGGKRATNKQPPILRVCVRPRPDLPKMRARDLLHIIYLHNCEYLQIHIMRARHAHTRPPVRLFSFFPHPLSRHVPWLLVIPRVIPPRFFRHLTNAYYLCPSPICQYIHIYQTLNSHSSPHTHTHCRGQGQVRSLLLVASSSLSSQRTTSKEEDHIFHPSKQAAKENSLSVIYI